MNSNFLSYNELMNFKYSNAVKHGYAVYICSPYKGDVKVNVMRALHYCRFVLDCGKFPVAPHCYLPRFMDDDDPAERELALSFGLRLLRRCREMWVFGDTISYCMSREIEAAKRHRIPIRYFTADFKEICKLIKC
jgi:hypothetical protein